MNIELLKKISVELNGRTFDPKMEEYITLLANDLQQTLSGIRDISKDFPLSLEPAPVFAPQKQN